MQYVSEEDFFEIRLAGILSDGDRKILCDLYQPLVGSHAIALYFKLWSNANRDHEKGFYSTSCMLNNLQMTTSELLIARQRLEALGLLNTYQKIIDSKRLFIYNLNAPKQPDEFFCDPIFKGMLLKYLGEGEVSRLISSYKSDLKLDGYEEISAGIMEVFHPNLNDDCFRRMPDIPHLKSRRSGKIKIDFDLGLFFKACLEKSSINENFFHADELDYIKKMASVYGANEEVMAEAVSDSIKVDAKLGERLDINQLSSYLKTINDYPILKQKKDIKNTKIKRPSDTQYAQMLNVMEDITPYKFLSYRQNNTTPSNADLALVERLATRFGLSTGVINALISYVLDVKQNTLPSAYTEKIAGSLAREGIVSAVAAINFLTKTHQTSFKKTNPNNVVNRTKENEESDEEYVPSYRPSSED